MSLTEAHDCSLGVDSMPSFNLVRDPWITCLMGSGPPQDLSLREAISRAAEVRAINTDSPLATAAIHRLLLAILYRAGVASDDAGWSTHWASRDIAAPEALRYLDRWETRFDLFDEAHPFYQTAGLGAEYGSTVAKLTHELNAGNNAALFDHSLDDDPQALTPPEAARALVALQAFAVGGLLSFEKGRTEDKSADAAPLVKAGLVLVMGENLAETLLLNLFHVDPEAPDAPFEFDPGADKPAWERDEPTRAMDRRPDGPLDLLTWQSRRVRLLPEVRDGVLAVRRAVIMKGNQFPTGFLLGQHEPMVAFRRVAKPATGQDPMPPVGFRPERALWRDSIALLMNTEPDAAAKREGHRRPQNLASLATRSFAGSDPRPRVTALGLGADRAKLLLWRQEELPLPLAYLDPDNGELVARLDRCLKLAMACGQALRMSAWRLAADVLSPEGNPDRKRVDALTESLQPERPYWAALDTPFRRLMVDLAATQQTDGGHAALGAWSNAVEQAARDAFDTATDAIETNARGFRAGAVARGMFGSLLAREVHQFREQFASLEVNE